MILIVSCLCNIDLGVVGELVWNYVEFSGIGVGKYCTSQLVSCCK